LIRAEQCDITDADAVARVRDRLRDDWKAIDAVVNAAGVNIPRRSWSDVSTEDFRNVVATNLFGSFLVTRAFLPLLRGQAGATVVNIVSDAGLLGSAKAGVPYVAAKFGQTGLVESLNAELRDCGVRACGIFPGDINTAMLDDRAVPPTREQRAGMLQPEDVAECVMLAITLPPRAIVEKLVVRPR
jgi:NAD(P)-dependent dehydrogenase (short-subunit alcohol dehydrogenase family)